MNDNAVTKTANSSTKSPELLARHCDSLLKKRYLVKSCTCTCIVQWNLRENDPLGLVVLCIVERLSSYRTLKMY